VGTTPARRRRISKIVRRPPGRASYRGRLGSQEDPKGPRLRRMPPGGRARSAENSAHSAKHRRSFSAAVRPPSPAPRPDGPGWAGRASAARPGWAGRASAARAGWAGRASATRAGWARRASARHGLGRARRANVPRRRRQPGADPHQPSTPAGCSGSVAGRCPGRSGASAPGGVRRPDRRRRRGRARSARLPACSSHTRR
jgi:hypothetical protein